MAGFRGSPQGLCCDPPHLCIPTPGTTFLKGDGQKS